jgi:hypothetical protein
MQRNALGGQTLHGVNTRTSLHGLYDRRMNDEFRFHIKQKRTSTMLLA